MGVYAFYRRSGITGEVYPFGVFNSDTGQTLGDRPAVRQLVREVSGNGPELVKIYGRGVYMWVSEVPRDFELYDPRQPRDKDGKFASGGGGSGGLGYPTGDAAEALRDRMWEFEPGWMIEERPETTGISQTSIWEMETGERVLYKQIEGGHAAGEVAAYDVAVNYLGIDTVPPIVENEGRIGEFGVTTQIFVEDGRALGAFGYNLDRGGSAYYKYNLDPDLAGQINAEDMTNMAMLDIVTGNPDRHDGNMLITGSGRVLAIDNDSAFHPGVSSYEINAKQARNSVDQTMYRVGSKYEQMTGQPLEIPASRLAEVGALKDDFMLFEEAYAVGGQSVAANMRTRLTALAEIAGELGPDGKIVAGVNGTFWR